ncbi:MAG: peptidase, partial [Cryomorphaceae bacterium BACL29 MAG-121220-bin8]
SVEEAFAKSVIFGFEIKEFHQDYYLIDFTPFLMQDSHGVSNRLKNLDQGSYILDLTKSALNMERTKAFPKNVEFEALLTFKNSGDYGRMISSVSPDPSLISVIQHHSFIELPDDNYKPRKFDSRSGGIPISYMDYASPVHEPIIKRLLIRHRLEKVNPNLDFSEVKKPIVYYLDPGTPEPVRSALLEGSGWWNEAFESIGYKNAFQVKILPENADPMDCRYNVIQWVHRSTRGWSYGASVVDPRTGEIIKGHVSLGSLRIRQDFLIAQALISKPFEKNNSNYKPMLNMALSRIRQLSAHEVGHTLGFTHNFASSTNERASVMDYPHPLISLNNDQIDLSDAYSKGIGEWDKVSVAYSYSEFDSINEKNELENILKQANLEGLRFITDNDARSQGGAHVSAHLWDNGKDVISGLYEVFKVRDKAIKDFSEFNIKSSEPYSVLEDVFVPLYFMHRYQTEAVVKLIGGLDYNYALRGDGQLIVEDLNLETQKNALVSVLKSLDANNLAIPRDKLKLFPPRAFGFPRTRESFNGKTGVSFDPFSAALTASEMTLSLLLNPQRLNRIMVQHSLDNSNLTVSYLLRMLISNSFKKRHDDYYVSQIQHIINTNLLIHLLNLTQEKKVYMQLHFEAKKAIKYVKRLILKSKKSYTYREEYLYIIQNFKEFPELYEINRLPMIPDGSPIGTNNCSLN